MGTGSGCFGDVCLRVLKSQNNMLVAVKYAKKFNRDAIRDFLNEMKILKDVKLDSTNYIVKFYGGYIDETVAYSVLEHANGGSLLNFIQDRINKQNFISYPEYLDFCLQITRGVFELHSNNFLHRDISPKNFLVFLEKHGNRCKKVKICDFGLSQEITSKNGEIIHTGKSVYCPRERSAPEIKDLGKSTFQSDIYSLGYTFQEIFDEIKEYEKKMKKKTEEFHVPNLMGNLIEKCLSYDPIERPESLDIMGQIEGVLYYPQQICFLFYFILFIFIVYFY